MIPRTAETRVRDLLSGFPIITVTGPRQSGKTTLAREVMADRPYRSLEDPDVRALALDDPRGFLSQCSDGGCSRRFSGCRNCSPICRPMWTAMVTWVGFSSRSRNSSD